MTSAGNLDRIRSDTLDRIDRRERAFKASFFGAVLLEALLLGAFLYVADLKNPLHVLILIASVLVYGTLALGLFALGAHVSRVGERVLAAIELAAARDR